MAGLSLYPLPKWVRDMDVRRSAQMPANRKNPGVHPAARQSRDREGALADSAAGMRSGPRGYPGRGSDWGFTAVHFQVASTPGSPPTS